LNHELPALNPNTFSPDPKLQTPNPTSPTPYTPKGMDSEKENTKDPKWIGRHGITDDDEW